MSGITDLQRKTSMDDPRWMPAARWLRLYGVTVDKPPQERRETPKPEPKPTPKPTQGTFR